MWGSFSTHAVEGDICSRDAAHFHGDLLQSLSLLPLSLQDLSWCLDEEPWESLSWVPWCSFDGGEHLWWCEDFLLRESVDVFGERARGDFPQDLEGSPSLLVELGTSPEAQEDQDFSLDSAVGDSSV